MSPPSCFRVLINSNGFKLLKLFVIQLSIQHSIWSISQSLSSAQYIFLFCFFSHKKKESNLRQSSESLRLLHVPVSYINLLLLTNKNLNEQSMDQATKNPPTMRVCLMQFYLIKANLPYSYFHYERNAKLNSQYANIQRFELMIVCKRSSQRTHATFSRIDLCKLDSLNLNY